MSYRGKGTAHISAMFMINLRLLANRFNFEVEVAFLATPLMADVVLSYRGLLFCLCTGGGGVRDLEINIIRGKSNRPMRDLLIDIIRRPVAFPLPIETRVHRRRLGSLGHRFVLFGPFVVPLAQHHGVRGGIPSL